jgi:hypothetical protein
MFIVQAMKENILKFLEIVKKESIVHTMKEHNLC